MREKSKRGDVARRDATRRVGRVKGAARVKGVAEGCAESASEMTGRPRRSRSKIRRRLDAAAAAAPWRNGPGSSAVRPRSFWPTETARRIGRSFRIRTRRHKSTLAANAVAAAAAAGRVSKQRVRCGAVRCGAVAVTVALLTVAVVVAIAATVATAARNLLFRPSATPASPSQLSSVYGLVELSLRRLARRVE